MSKGEREELNKVKTVLDVLRSVVREGKSWFYFDDYTNQL